MKIGNTELMSKVKTMPTLKEILLIYVGYILPRQKHDLHHAELQKLLKKVTGKKYSVGTLRKELSLATHCKFVEPQLKYQRRTYALTDRGRMAIAIALPKHKTEPWDGKWRIVALAVPSKDRASTIKITKLLQAIGFRKLLKNIYISPNQSAALIERAATELGIRQHILISKSTSIERQNIALQRGWDVRTIKQEYETFIKSAKRQMRHHCHKPEWPIIAKRIEYQFTPIYMRDPNLPAELLPHPWPAQEAIKVLKEIARSLK